MRLKEYSGRGFRYMATFHNTMKGQTLSEIKQNEANAEIFASAACVALAGQELSDATLVCAPARRHLRKNFAEQVCRLISIKMGLNYMAGAVICRSRDRLRPSFYLKNPIPSKKVIIYDDIVTTGITLQALVSLFENKETVVLAGIENDHPIKT